MKEYMERFLDATTSLLVFDLLYKPVNPGLFDELLTSAKMGICRANLISCTSLPLFVSVYR